MNVSRLLVRSPGLSRRSDRGQRLPDPFSRDARTMVADLNEAVAALGNYDIDAGRSLERDRPVTRTPYHVERILHIFADRVARLDLHARRQGLGDIGTDQKFRRSEERRVGKECVSTCRSGWSPYP